MHGLVRPQAMILGIGVLDRVGRERIERDTAHDRHKAAFPRRGNNPNERALREVDRALAAAPTGASPWRPSRWPRWPPPRWSPTDHRAGA
jgi:hypothetical protein